uniref:Chemokine interleukin-8-like domain-containing protein n=1 Tax=Poecilia reticulata TaxID=8081 RepID=A0A3P9PB48_POERE
MQFSLILTSLFCFTIWINMVQASKYKKISKTRVHHSKIEEYTIQDDDTCFLSAIVFRTVHGRIICADPNSKWAKHVIQKLEDSYVPGWILLTYSQKHYMGGGGALGQLQGPGSNIGPLTPSNQDSSHIM